MSFGSRPPRLARLLLRTLPLDAAREDVEADLLEAFEQRAAVDSTVTRFSVSTAFCCVRCPTELPIDSSGSSLKPPVVRPVRFLRRAASIDPLTALRE